MKFGRYHASKIHGKLWVLEAKIEENHEEGASKNYVFLVCVFESIFEGFGEGSEGFWQGVGTSLAFIGALSVFFFSGFGIAVPGPIFLWVCLVVPKLKFGARTGVLAVFRAFSD